MRAPYRGPTPLEDLSDEELRLLLSDLEHAILQERRRREEEAHRKFRKATQHFRGAT